MATPGSLSDREGDNSHKAIYERSTREASDGRAGGFWLRIATGTMTGAVLAFVFSEVGAPQIFGVSRLVMFIPFMTVGGLLGTTRFLKAIVMFALLTVLFVWIVSYTDIVRSLARGLIRSDPLPPAADAIVVLSAGVTADGMLPQQGVDRLLKGLELWKAGRAPRIVLTRELRKTARGWISTSSDQKRLIALAGQPQVILTSPVTSTRDEAVRVAALARRQGWKSLILVTSPFHSRRACATFEGVGLDVACAPSDSRDIAVRNRAGPDDRLRAFGMLMYEIAGTIRYRQAGWIR